MRLSDWVTLATRLPVGGWRSPGASGPLGPSSGRWLLRCPFPRRSCRVSGERAASLFSIWISSWPRVCRPQAGFCSAWPLGELYGDVGQPRAESFLPQRK